jgi:hypothetical protein
MLPFLAVTFSSARIENMQNRDFYWFWRLRNLSLLLLMRPVPNPALIRINLTLSIMLSFLALTSSSAQFELWTYTKFAKFVPREHILIHPFRSPTHMHSFFTYAFILRFPILHFYPFPQRSCQRSAATMSCSDPDLTNESGSNSYSDFSATNAHEFNLSIALQRLDQFASQHLASYGTQLVTRREFSALVEAVAALQASGQTARVIPWCKILSGVSLIHWYNLSSLSLTL